MADPRSDFDCEGVRKEKERKRKGEEKRDREKEKEREREAQFIDFANILVLSL